MIYKNVFARYMPYCALSVVFFALPIVAQTVQINDYASLRKIGSDATYPLSGSYELVADIDASASRTENGGAGFVPIGSQDAPFNGKFNGNGYKIDGLYINRAGSINVGLFAWADSAEFKRVVVAADTIIGASSVGILAGRANNSVIDSCVVSGVVVGNLSHTGGLAGRADECVITRCNFLSGFVRGQVNAGGLVGIIDGGRMVNCYSFGDVAGNEAVGGLAGSAGSVSGQITGSRSAGVIKGTNRIGGLIGYNSGAVTECRSTAAVDGRKQIGGLIGRNEGAVTKSSDSSSSVKGIDEVGGLIGGNYSGAVNNSYANASVFGDSIVGGLIGYNYGGKIDKCYYKTDIISNTVNVPGYGQVTEITYKDSINGTNNKVGGLIGFNQSAVAMSYSISLVKGKSNVGGLIGWNEDTVTQCYTKGAVIGTGSEIGGLIGSIDKASGTVKMCYSTSSVHGVKDLGGLVGNIHYNYPVITECYSAGSVGSDVVGSSIGGLIGYVYGQNNITRCYWDSSSSGRQRSAGGTALTTAEMKTSASFQGWDFGAVWQIDGFGKSYPYFRYETTVSIYKDRQVRIGVNNMAIPTVVMRGRTLNISASANSEYQVRVLDLRGKTHFRFTAVNGGSFFLKTIPAGRYLAEIRKNGKKINVTSFTI